MRITRFRFSLLFSLSVTLLVGVPLWITQTEVKGQKITRIGPIAPTGRLQPMQSPYNCQTCHERQFRENRQNLKSGYRSVSPTFNALELAANFTNGGALRPVYPPERNFSNTEEPYESASELVPGFCLGCHNGATLGQGDNNDINIENVAQREVPEWDGRTVPVDPENPDGQKFIDGETIRPLRDYHLVDAQGRQVLPEQFGGPPPDGAFPSQGAFGVTCDHCHNVTGPALERSLQGDGFGNAAVRLLFSSAKVGPFQNALPVAGNFHQSTNDVSRIDYLRSPLFCNACHDVRVPSGNVVAPDDPTHTPAIGHYRLENLGTEWEIGPYNSTTRNPFGQVVRCQDCHMSLYPYAGNTTYTVRDPLTGEDLEITSPTPAVFPTNFAAEPGIGTPAGVPLPTRQVVTHYFTGIDVPLLTDGELRDHLGEDYPSTDDPDLDEYGIPLSLRTRRDDLLQASLHMDLDRSDPQGRLGEKFTAKVRLIALTGHRFPSGFSQERTTWIQLTVSAKQRGTDDDFVLYQSGYLVDKPHPENGELQADGNIHDEDNEHVIVTVNPFTHDNEVFYFGPDDGPHARIFDGAREGLVLFRNELLRIYGPETMNGMLTGIAGNSRLHPRTGAVLEHPLEEETFSAGAANAVDNWRALPPLFPRTYSYEIELPSAEELAELGVELEGPLEVKAAVHFQHFPPLFLRFVSRATGSMVEENINNVKRLEPFVGLRGPANRQYGLYDEQRIDDLLRIVFDHTTADLTIPLEAGE